MKLLIDGDIIAYKAGFAAEKTKYLVVGEQFDYYDDAKAAKQVPGVLWSRKELQPLETALMIADVMINDIKDRYAAESPTTSLYLTGTGNFRHGIATRASYKGNRSGQLPPTHLKALRQHLVDKHKAVVSAGEEADDLIGIAMTREPSGCAVVCSIDKDLMQLPGRHYNFVEKVEVTVGAKEAAINFFCQVLSGDATDNIPGLPGIGPVKARKMLENARTPFDAWATCVAAYREAFATKGEEYALEAAQLVYVRRTPGEIWSPVRKDAKAA